jgi:prepilin-type N-terminal cleavage/methylation domain-containing protein
MKEVYLMKKRKSGEKGFTLIEVIVTLILVGITAALAGMWIVSVANGYLFAKVNAKTTQNAQLAMARLVKEFSAIRSVTTGSGTGITYNRTDSALGSVPVTVSINGSALQLNVNNAGNNTLTDSVSGFTLRYCTNSDLTQTTCPSTTWLPESRIIEINLILMGASNTTSTFTQRVAPRNL